MATDHDGLAEPFQHTIELSRAKDGSDPYAFHSGPQNYQRREKGSGIQEAELAWDAAVLEDLHAVQRTPRDPEAAARLGRLLGEFLRQTRWSERELVQALDAKRPIRLTIRLAAAELYALPWELLSLDASGSRLGRLRHCLLHYEWPKTKTTTPAAAQPAEGGRILFAWSAAAGAVPEADHLETIAFACAGRLTFDPQGDVLCDVSYDALAAKLDEATAAGRPFTVLHLLCHGGFLHVGANAYGLIWRNPSGVGRDARDAIDGITLGELLREHAPTLRLVVVCACQGGDAGEPGSYLGGIAQGIHRAGIEAVVASRFSLSSAGSVLLAKAFYQRLLAGLDSVEQAFLAARNDLGRKPGLADDVSLQLYVRAADGLDTRPVVFRPYRGLLAFHEEHAPYFFGREAERDEVLQKLAALAGRPRFLIVAGASGTGKSSLIHASVVPALRGKEPRWIVQAMRPAGFDAAIDVALAARLDPSAPLLLFVDQFEEVFTSIADPAARTAFVRRLWALSDDPASGVTVIATLRVDFFARCGEIELEAGGRTLEEVVCGEAHRVFVLRMKAEGLRAIALRPARLVGLSLEPGLAEQMVREAGNEPGALPLVEYTLDQLWQAREGRCLSMAAYHRLGGVAGALRQKADELLAGLGDAQRQAARRLLVQLVATHADASLNTRRRRPIAALRPSGKVKGAAFDEVLELLVQQRLLVRSDEAGERTPTVEMAHEALIRSWGTLRGWLEQDRQKLAELEQLHAWVEEDYVLEGDRLGHARELLKKYPDDIDAAARALVERSEEAEARRTREAEEQRRRELAQARRAREFALVAGARELIARGAPQWAMKVLAESEEPGLARGWEEAARELLGMPGLPRAIFHGHEGAVQSAAFSANGRRVVTASGDKMARVWNADGSGVPIVLQGHENYVRSAAFSADGRRVVTTSNDKTARVWNADGSGEPIVLQGHEHNVWSAAFSADGQRIVTASQDKTARVWSADGSGEPIVLRGHEHNVWSAAFSADGRRIVTASGDKTARVWNADGSGEPIVLQGHEDYVWSAAFSADGQRVVTTSNDKTARVWNADGSGEPTVLRGHKAGVVSAAFSADDRRVVTASDDKTARVWSADGSGEPIVLQGHKGHIQSVAFSADGRRVVTASIDKTARVWNADGSGEPIVLQGHEFWVQSAGFSADGRRVVTASIDKTARVWNADGSGEPIVLQGHEDDVRSAAFSADGRHVVTASDDKTARGWNADGSGEPIVLRGHEHNVWSAAFSADGQRIVTASQDKTARVWNADGSGEPIVLQGHEHNVWSAGLSADGRRVVTAALNKTARVWNADGSGEPIVLRGHEDDVWSAAFSPDGRRVITATLNKTARVRNPDSSGEPIVLQGHEDSVRAAGFSADGRRVVTAANDKTTRIWNADGSGEPIILQGHEDSVRAAGFSADGRRVVTASDDKTARVWNADGSGESIVLRGHEDSVRSAAFSADGRRVVTASDDKTARVWNADGSDELIVLRGHEDSVRSAAFSADGQRVVTTSDDKTARVWNADGSGEPIVLRGHEDSVRSAAFSADGQRVVTTSDDKTARIWTLPLSALHRMLREASTLCLPPALRRTYLDETDAEAQSRYEACERSHGRTPPSSA